MKRKSPIKHSVKSYRKQGKTVRAHSRGHGIRVHALSNPSFSKKQTLLDTRLEAKINELKTYRNMSARDRNHKMVHFYQVHIDALSSCLGKTRKEVMNEIYLMGDELSSARAGNADFDRLYPLEKSFELLQKITGIKYKYPKYVLAQGKQQSGRVIGYRPASEKLVWMSPDKFLFLTPRAFYSDQSVSQLRDKMRNNDELDALWLDVDINTHHVLNHEGRHRAKAAQDLGIQKIPVVLYAKSDREWESAHTLPSIEQIKRQM